MPALTFAKRSCRPRIKESGDEVPPYAIEWTPERLKELRDALPPDYRRRYDRIRKRFGDAGALAFVFEAIHFRKHCDDPDQQGYTEARFYAEQGITP